MHTDFRMPLSGGLSGTLPSPELEAVAVQVFSRRPYPPAPVQDEASSVLAVAVFLPR